MAVVWAKSNGNWTNTSLWAFWNETTQQIEDYGRVPRFDDVVYCNGFQITCNTTIAVKSISNDLVSHTGNSGGNLYYTSNYTLTADLYQAVGLLIRYNVNGVFGAFVVNGNCVNNNSYLIKYESGANYHLHSLQIIGNVNANYALIQGNNNYASSAFPKCQIVGNLTINYIHIYEHLAGNVNVNDLLITGNLTIDVAQNYTVINATILGVIYANNSLTITNLIISGAIYYKSNDNTFGIIYKTLSILNPDTFIWKDITDPRANPFIIVTNYDMNNRQQYPPENEVKEGTEYVWGEKVGTYQQPPESVVLKGYVYDNGDKIGSLENQNIVGCVTREDVREGVELIGLQEVGTLVVPDVDDVREGVIFDNGSVGTLIVEGGGDRLRIANFGYYTDSQSDTYIVDINESFKPMFATAEESVLLELFPELDLDNIPDKYFDDLFVKYLKYRLIVEYYRGAGINSVFTPSELTTEVVNYQNVRCEYWLNLANIYLNAWDKKYPNSVKKQRILL